MILKELNMVSFGKFKNQIIELKAGLNIVYGENEAGKTTIHNFIEGMFYGFLKPYAKRRYFLEELDKYRPWHGEKYVGILTLQKGDKSYRIERDFNKGEVKVYDELTGKDITAEIDLGEKIKIHLPGLYFFSFNSFVYRNTISIKQLGNKVDADLSKEIKDKLANITTSLDDDISVKNAISYLEEKLEQLGTERAYTKPYGRAVRELERLQRRRKEALQKKIDYEETEYRFLQLKEEIQEREGEIFQLKAQLERAKLLEMKKTYDEAMKLKGEIDILDKQIATLKSYSSLQEEDYYVALKLDNQISMLTKERDSLSERLKSIDDKLEEVRKKEAQIIEGKAKYDQLYEAFVKYNQLEEEKNTLLINSLKDRLEIAITQLKAIREKKRSATIKAIISFIVLLISLGLYPVSSAFLVLAGIATISAVYSIYLNIKLKKEEKELEVRIKELEYREGEREDRLDYIHKEQRAILEKYNCSSKIEFNGLYEDIRFKITSRSALSNEIESLHREKGEVEKLLAEKEKQKLELKYELEGLMDKNKVNSLEAFKEALGKKRDYHNLTKDRENKLGLLDNLLRNTNLEELKEKVAQLEDEADKEIGNINVREREEEVKLKEKILEELKYEYSKLEERMDILDGHIQELINIEEAIAKIERDIESLKEEIQAINITKNVIEKLSERIHKQFAPEINKSVSQLISFVTDGRYGNIKIDENLDIAIENSTTGEIIPLESLSGGTIDQIYFALRFSIINSMKKDSFPLILDDCFIQYDDRRLENILNFLVKLSERKQIILFTCHHREKEILDNMNIKYNFISLT